MEIEHPSMLPHRFDTGLRTSSDVIDLGLVTAIGTRVHEIEVEISSQTRVYVTIDGIGVEPSILSEPGHHRIYLSPHFPYLAPGALLEGFLIIESESQLERIRITGFVDDSAFLTPQSSLVINPTPWELVHILSTDKSRVHCITFINDGKELFSGSEDGFVRRWDSVEGIQTVPPLSFGAPVRSIVSSPNDRYFALGLGDGTIHLQETISHKNVWTRRIHKGFISALAFSPDSNTLVAGAGDRSISIWECSSGELRCEPIRQIGVITSIALAGTGHIIASTSQTKNKIFLWEMLTGVLLRELQGHRGNIWSVAFSLDGHTLISGSTDKTVGIWDVTTGVMTNRLEGFSKDVFSVAFSPDGKMIATASGEPKVRVWDFQSRTRLATLESGNVWVRGLAFSPHQEFLAAALYDGTVNIWAITN